MILDCSSSNSRKIIKPKITHPLRTKQHVVFENLKIDVNAIKWFYIVGKKKDNDKSNKIREKVISAIINNKIPPSFYKAPKWAKIKKDIDDFIDDLALEHDIEQIDSIKCIMKGGRKFHHDFEIVINNSNTFNIEFKFNVTHLDQAPQFVSPHKPSRFLQLNYEEFFYDNYLGDLVMKYNFESPDKQIYLSTIHGPKPECVKMLQLKYYQGCSSSSKYTGDTDCVNFYNDFKKASKDSIEEFINNSDLLIDKLSDYLLDTQSGKFYMLYTNQGINLYHIKASNYRIKSYTKHPDKSKYIATTESGLKLNILLRWKNGNGIAYPAFQIK